MWVAYDTDGAEFTYEEEMRPVRVVVGLGGPDFENAFDGLCHEAFEFAFWDLGIAFHPAHYEVYSPGALYFSFHHADWTEACSRASKFIYRALPHLKAAWNTLNSKARQK